MRSHDDNHHSKTEALRRDGTLNDASSKVGDPKFQEGEFFDPRDVVQVKYEMLRRVLMDNHSVTEVVAEYGFSRPTYYQAKTSFEKAGVAGLVPKKRGPQGPHKLRPEVLEFLRRHVHPGRPIRAKELAELTRKELGLELHPRTIERALGGEKKTTPV